jgi:hypothetical protein
VVAYSRLFTQNEPFGPLKKEWGRFADPELQYLHDALVKLKNQTVAHSDYAIRKVLIIPPGVPRPDRGTPKTGTDVTSHRSSILELREGGALVPRSWEPTQSSNQC